MCTHMILLWTIMDSAGEFCCLKIYRREGVRGFASWFETMALQWCHFTLTTCEVSEVYTERQMSKVPMFVCLLALFYFFKEMLNKWSVEIMGCEECARHGLTQAQIVRIEYLYNLYLGESYHKYVWYEFNCWCDRQSFYLSVILLTICHLCVSPFQWSSLLRHR